MHTQSGSKLRTARQLAGTQPSDTTGINLLDRVSILAGLLFTLQQATTSEAGGAPASALVAEDQSTALDIQLAQNTAGSAHPSETANLPAAAGGSEATQSETSPAAGSVGHPLAGEAGVGGNITGVPPEADEAPGKAGARHGSATSPSLLNIDVDDNAGSAALSMSKLIVATSSSDVLVGQIPSTTFVFTGPASPDNFDVFIGTGRQNTVDFSNLPDLATPSKSGSSTEHDHRDASAPNGVYVDLTADWQTKTTAAGTVTVQAWQLDADGKAAMPLAHLENIDNVIGTVGNDIVVGNEHANTFTYTAADGTTEGQAASYGFDIYYGGAPGGDAGSSDGQDTADFSRLGSQESVAAANGADQTVLPHDAKGITVDLAQSVTITTVDPQTGEATTVSGSMVSTIGGAETTDLALLAWTEADEGGESHATIEQIVTSGGADAIWGDDAANTVVVTGTGESGATFVDGRGGNDTIDFSRLSPSSAPAEAQSGGSTDANSAEPASSPASTAAIAPSAESETAASSAPPVIETLPAATAGTAEAAAPAAAAEVVIPNGVYVNLSATEQTAESSVGTVTVQAWLIDADGKADTPLAHLENIETVVGTVGNDVLVGDDAANTFVYTANDDAVVTADGQIEVGPDASYGFDIYYGGDRGCAHTTADVQDTADFSILGSQESVAAAAAEGVDQVLLPHGATGITVDLAVAVTITTVDPETGDLMQVTGSMVSTIGGSEQTDLALLAWTAPEDGSAGHATIENIVTTGGADAIWGDDADNTVVVSGTGEDGAVFFDGRGGDDTIDFSQLSLADPNAGIEIHLNQTMDGVTDPTGGTQSGVVAATTTDGQTTVALVKNVENVVGTSGNDIIEGDEHDNILTGGGGSDTFIFTNVAVVDGRGVTKIGHDIIKDFNRADIGDDGDFLVFDSSIFNFHDGTSLDWLQELLTNHLRDSDEGTIIWIDDNNSITLQNYDLHDSSGHGDGLSAYSSWIIFV